MLSYIIRRLLLVLPTLIGMTMVVFFVMALAPGGVGAALLSQEGTMRPEERKARQAYLEKRYGLNKPPYVQYFRWLNKVSPIGWQPRADGITPWYPVFKTPDLGESFSRGRPVIELIKEALPVTLTLNLIAFPLIYTVAILSGIKMARHRGKAVDIVAGTGFVALWSIPVIWAGVLLVGFLANREYLKLFPTNGLHDLYAGSMPFLPGMVNGEFQRGWLLDYLWHLVLPVICLSYAGFAVLSKLTRASLLENIAADFVRTARAKGVSESAVLYQHAFRNSLIPLITVGAHIIPGLLGGAVVVETIFGINGMGRMIVEAVFLHDSELVLSETMIVGLLGLLSYLLADIAYAVADPRVSYE